MSDWEFRYQEPEGSYATLNYDFQNVIGTPLYEAGIAQVQEGDGYFANPLVSGIYTITFIDSTHITITSADGYDRANPYLSETSVTISDFDWNYDIIPGLKIVFSSPSAGDICRIGIGCDLVQPVLEEPPYWIRRFPIGPVVAGRTSIPYHYRIYNMSGVEKTGCMAYVTNAIRVENIAANAKPFEWFRQHGDLNPSADSNLNGMAVTFDNFIEGPYFPYVDILVNGNQISVYDVKNDVTIPDGTGLGLDSDNEFQFSDGTKYQSGRFKLNELMQETDTAILYVSDGGSFIQVSTDGNTYVAGTTGVELTEDGEDDGVIGIGGYADLYLRANVPLASSSSLNLRLFSLRIGSD